MTENKDIDVCQIHNIHTEKVKLVQKEMPKDSLLINLAELFKLLGDPTRVQILFALSQSELCVCDLCEILKMSASAVSHQLRVLRTAKLITYRREGKNVFYNLDDEHVHRLFKQTLEHVQE